MHGDFDYYFVGYLCDHTPAYICFEYAHDRVVRAADAFWIWEF